MADIRVDLSNSSKYTVNLWEQGVPYTAGMSAPGGNTKWSSAILGPPTDEFAFHVLQGSLKSLSDGELAALESELNKQIQQRGLDPVLYQAWIAVIFEQQNRKKDEKAPTKCGGGDFTKCGAYPLCLPGLVCEHTEPNYWYNP